MNESWYHITSEIGIILVVLLVLALLISIVQLRTINKLKKNRVDEANITEKEKDSVKAPIKDIGINESEETESIEEIKAQLKSKTIELAKIAKENDQKSQLLSDLKERLTYLKEHPSALERITKDAFGLIDSVNFESKDTFEFQIDELNQVFYNRLRELYPELTNNDLRLCAYVKIGMDSKEIAKLFSIKPSSIYINRSRLRKKLDLEPEEDLYAFLNSDF